MPAKARQTKEETPKLDPEQQRRLAARQDHDFAIGIRDSRPDPISTNEAPAVDQTDDSDK